MSFLCSLFDVVPGPDGELLSTASTGRTGRCKAPSKFGVWSFCLCVQRCIWRVFIAMCNYLECAHLVCVCVCLIPFIFAYLT